MIFKLIVFLLINNLAASVPYLATGIKIGEVSPDKAIVWTRLTMNPRAVGSNAPLPTVEYRDPKTGAVITRQVNRRPDAEPKVVYPEGYDVRTIQGAAPGIDGLVRVLYQRAGEAGWQETAWLPVIPDHDFTRQFKLAGLRPDSRYLLRVESKSTQGGAGEIVTGEFKTAPLPDRARKITFVVVTGQNYVTRDDGDRGFKIYPEMLKLRPDFFVHTGDIVYYDQLAKNLDLARWYWQITYSYPSNVEFHRQVSSYFIKDDHDTWMNDFYPGMQTRFMGDFTFVQGQQVFLDEVPMGERTFRTFRWGRDLQIWMVEGRDFRSPNDAPDGPDKTIWGKEQKEWFKKTVRASDAAFRILISPTPLLGPDRSAKNDNHANKGFTHEGDELRAFVAAQKSMIVINGDRHWQYVSRDAKTGLMEFGSGPFTDKHAGGWSNDQVLPEHKYLNVVGGFLSVSVDRVGDVPTMVLRHHGVTGRVLHQETLSVGK